MSTPRPTGTREVVTGGRRGWRELPDWSYGLLEEPASPQQSAEGWGHTALYLTLVTPSDLLAAPIWKPGAESRVEREDLEKPMKRPCLEVRSC